MAFNCWKVEIELEGPFITQASSLVTHGIDQTLARKRAGDGREIYYIPRSAFKGKLRQAFEQLASVPGLEIDDRQIVALCGKGSGNSDTPGVSVQPFRAGLHFADLEGPECRPLNLRRRIRIEEERACADDGAVLVQESPFAAGERIVFSGLVEGEGGDEITLLLKRALRLIPSFGADRTIGSGRVLKTNIDKVARAATPPAPGIDQNPWEQIALLLTPTGPFCIPGRRISDNLFESESIISGGILRGLVAGCLLRMAGGGTEISRELGNALPAYKELWEHFSAVRFTHAFPAPKGTAIRPVAVPLSTVTTRAGGNTERYDVLRCQKAGMIVGQAPKFAPDWKRDAEESVVSDFGWTSPPRQLSVRTAIDSQKLRSRTGQLFAYEQICPDGFEWLSTLDLGGVPETARTAVANQIGGLLGEGVSGLGKTKAHIKGVASTFAAKHLSVPVPVQGCFAILLNTGALLCDPRRLTRATGDEELQAAYADVWSQLSDGQFTLKRFFARHKLTGGYFLHRRYQAGKPYEPWLLTEPGSVFLLEGDSLAAANLIQKWSTQGLALPPWAEERYARDGNSGNHWTNNPFIRQNGYGEIAVNLAVHTIPADFVEVE